MVSMWEVKASSLGNVYLSKQYANMSDAMRKRSLRKRFQVFEQNCQVEYENSRSIIEATELKTQEEEARLLAQTFIPSALSRCNYIRQKYEKYGTHSQKNLHKSKQIETILNNIPYSM